MEIQEPRKKKRYDRIEASLSHPYLRRATKWGFAIVRTVYGPASEVQWAQLLELIHTNVADTLWIDKQEEELLPFHQVTTLENEETLAGADSYAVRHAFRAWVAADLPQQLRGDFLEEVSASTQVHDKFLGNSAHDAPDITNPASCVPPRWKYCIFFDEDCLRSIAQRPEELNLKDPALKILTTDWELEEEEVPTEEFTTRDWDGGATDDEYEEVGWMYMHVSDYVAMYDRLIDAFAWHEYYERPYKSYVEDSD